MRIRGGRYRRGGISARYSSAGKKSFAFTDCLGVRSRYSEQEVVKIMSYPDAYDGLCCASSYREKNYPQADVWSFRHEGVERRSASGGTTSCQSVWPVIAFFYFVSWRLRFCPRRESRRFSRANWPLEFDEKCQLTCILSISTRVGFLFVCFIDRTLRIYWDLQLGLWPSFHTTHWFEKVLIILLVFLIMSHCVMNVGGF